MKHPTPTLLLAALLLALASCRPADAPGKHFPAVCILYPHEAPIGQVIKMGGIWQTDDYLILQNVYDGADSLFYVYSKADSLRYLYAFCPRGNGPGEYLMPAVIRNLPGNRFAFRDHATDTYAFFQLTDTAARLEKAARHPLPDGFCPWEMNYAGHDRYLLKRSNGRRAARELWSLTDGFARLDTLPNTFASLPQELGDDYYPEFDDCWLAVSDTLFAAAYFLIDRIEFGKIKGDSLVLTASTGVSRAPEFYLYTDTPAQGEYEYNVENNQVHYEALAATPRGVYALYAEVPWGDLEPVHSMQIEHYGWDGQARTLFMFPKSISAFVVDEKRRCIYGINPDTHEDAILYLDLP